MKDNIHNNEETDRKITITAENVTDKIRIDKFIEKELKKRELNLSRNQIQNLIENGCIQINNQSVKKKYIVNKEDTIIISLPPVEEKVKLKYDETIPVKIIYEDEYLIVVDKAPGIVVHPAKGNNTGTLVNALLNKLEISNDSHLRPGIVHRLDKDTSGLIVIAKTDEVKNILIEEFKNRKIRKIYHCITHKKPNFKEKTIKTNIGRHPYHRKKFAVTKEDGKYAKTKFKVLEFYKENALIEAELFTGRTHQIRVHLSHLKIPIAGDPLYSRSSNKYPEGMALVAKILSFNHPVHKKPLHFECDYPEHFIKLLKRIQDK